MLMTKYSVINAASFLVFVISIMLNAARGEKNLKFANDDLSRPGTWCIAKPSDPPEQLVNMTLNPMWCGVGDCRLIEEGELCYEPNTLYSHASVAVNQLYVSPDSFDYGCNGLIVLTDPSHGNCPYESYPTDGENFVLANKHEKTFCVPKPSASEQELIANIEYACAQLGDCSRINPNGPCFYPDDILNHASVVMNMYHALNGRTNSSCNFSNSGLISLTDPSYKSLYTGSICDFD